MEIREIRDTAFAMPFTSPSYPKGPYRYVSREYLTLTYATDRAAVDWHVPEPLRARGDTARLHFVNTPDSTGFGDYQALIQTIPVVTPDGHDASFVQTMFLDAHVPIAAGRELWGFPSKLAAPSLRVERDTLVGTMDFGPVRVATATMGFKHHRLEDAAALAQLGEPLVMLKIIPGVDGAPEICELVRARLSDIVIRGAWAGPGALELAAHALAPLIELPVRRLIAATHVIADSTLELGDVIHDYLAPEGAL